MAKQELVTVENIKNPAVKRQMTVASAKFNSKIWRVVGTEKPAEVKKKDVSPVAAKPGKLPDATNSFVSQANDDLGTAQALSEFAKIGEPTEKEKLQAEYQAKAGKAPDKRWNEARLRQEISELNNPDHA